MMLLPVVPRDFICPACGEPMTDWRGRVTCTYNERRRAWLCIPCDYLAGREGAA